MTSPLPLEAASCPEFLRIGPVRVSPALLLAPMAGLTDATFRRVVRRCGGVGLVVTELVSSEGLVRGGARTEEILRLLPDEHPAAIQIAGADPVRMAEAAKLCEAEGADVVDLNMGCPAPKVTRTRSGVALMRDPKLAARVAEAVVKAVSLPVTAKMRLGWSEGDMTFLETARALQDVGISGLTLHARTGKQGYSGKADWTKIAELKEAVSLPVVGNGDVTRPEEALALWRETGCDGIMIGRAAVKNPWIFSQVESLRATGIYRPPTLEERFALMEEHFGELLESAPPPVALHRMKSFLGKYTAGMEGASALRRSLNGHRSPGELLSAFKAWANRSS